MKNIKFNDWQEMALKKDMETIIKKLHTQEPIFFSLCWEIIIALGTIIVDHLFDTEKNIILWVVVIVSAVLPPAVIIIYKTYKWLSSVKKVASGIYDIKDMVDTFDNQICYWVMTCNSYCNLLATMDKKNEKIFLYQEGCYYNNKSMQTLYHMKPIIDKVFSDKKEKIIGDNIVAVYRLLSLLDMMNQNQVDLDNSIKNIKNDPVIQEQLIINETYQALLCQFIEDLNNQFNKQFEWKKNTTNS